MGHAIAVFHHEGQVYAVDNRCPHMGFPLDRGSVSDGILTCHWHHARFDLSSGGTFNPFADDVRSFPVSVVDGEIWIDPEPPERDEGQHWRRRLEEGLEHNIRLVIAKSVLGLQASGADYRDALSIGTQFGTTYSANGWGAAMSILTCTANILPHLHDDDRSREPCTRDYGTWPGSARERPRDSQWSRCPPERPARRCSSAGSATS